MSIDLSRTSNFAFGGAPSSSKRMSFTPVTGSPAAHPGHRRRASNFSVAGGDQDGASVLSIPTGPSDVFGLASPRSPLIRHESDLALQKQFDTLKQQLEETRAELSEAVEGRESSDMLAKTLRAFIDEHNVGHATPPPPEMPRRLSSETKAPPARWGFGLWRSPDISKDAAAPPQGHAPSASVTAPSPPTAVEPLTKKLGGFFSNTRRMSQVSVVSTSMSPPMPYREPPALDAEYSSSTASSVDTPEPTSPVDALHRTLSIDATPGAKTALLSDAPGDVQIVAA